jgi:hypothetical protein
MLKPVIGPLDAVALKKTCNAQEDLGRLEGNDIGFKKLASNRSDF